MRCEICETSIYNCTCPPEKRTICPQCMDPHTNEDERCNRFPDHHKYCCEECFVCQACDTHAASRWSDNTPPITLEDGLCQDEERCTGCCDCVYGCGNNDHDLDWDDIELEEIGSEYVQLQVPCANCDVHLHTTFTRADSADSWCND